MTMKKTWVPCYAFWSAQIITTIKLTFVGNVLLDFSSFSEQPSWLEFLLLREQHSTGEVH